jgi:hypothetical protein
MLQMFEAYWITPAAPDIALTYLQFVLHLTVHSL